MNTESMGNTENKPKSHRIRDVWIAAAATILAALIASKTLPIDRIINTAFSSSDITLFENSLSIEANKIQMIRENGENHHLRAVFSIKNISDHNIEILMMGAPPNAQDNNEEVYTTKDSSGVKHLANICGKGFYTFDGMTTETCLYWVKQKAVAMHTVEPGGFQPLELELMPSDPKYKPDAEWLKYINFTLLVKGPEKAISDIVSLENQRITLP